MAAQESFYRQLVKHTLDGAAKNRLGLPKIVDTLANGQIKISVPESTFEFILLLKNSSDINQRRCVLCGVCFNVHQGPATCRHHDSRFSKQLSCDVHVL